MLAEARDGAVAILTLNQPRKRNALSKPMRDELQAAMTRIEVDRTVRAVVLTGAGGHFCSGGDIGSMAEIDDLAAGRERFRTTHELLRLLIQGSKPIIAAVEGWAAGAGVGVALACDVIVAADGARFATTFGKVGLVADFGILHTLPARIGASRARQMLLFGEPVSSTEALAIGLADATCPSGEALATALDRAERLAAAAPLPIAYTKAHFAKGLDDLLAWERDSQSTLLLTADHAEGRAAFLEKRPPVFRGQ